MSIESAKNYIERLKTDEEFRNTVISFSTSQERTKFIRTKGFDFTKDEVLQATKCFTDDELSKVAEGKTDIVCVDYPCGMRDIPFPF